MIKVISFYEDTITANAYQIENYIKNYNISKEQIISISHSEGLRTKTALLVYEENNK